MISKLYVVFDRVAEESGPVYEAKNDGIAIRNFKGLQVKSKCFDDLRLLCVGHYDTEKCKITAYPIAVEVVANADTSNDLEGEKNE